MSEVIDRTSDLENNPKIRKLLDRLATEMKSIRETMVILYRATLEMRIPDYAILIKDSDENDNLLNRIQEMETDLKTVMASTYMEGCFEDIVIGVENGSSRPLSSKKRDTLLTLVQKGENPEEAHKKVYSHRGAKLVDVKYFTFRAPNRGEQARVYLAEAAKAWIRYLKDRKFEAIVDMRVAPPANRKSKTTSPQRPTWVGA
jgi:hypothetical protein